MIKVKDREELREIIRKRYKESEVNKTYTIDVGDLDVSNVEDMSLMLCGFCPLEEIKGIENWNVSNVEVKSWMFDAFDYLEQHPKNLKINIINLKIIKGSEDE